jgi:hypothetical protein
MRKIPFSHVLLAGLLSGALLGRMPAVLSDALSGALSTAGARADEPSADGAPAGQVTPAEQQAVQQLRRFATNVQFNKDGTVRLMRLSKPIVSDEMLEHLQHLSHIDYLAIVCPQVTDAGIQHIRLLSNLDTLMLAESGVTDAGLAHLRSLQKLERLDLSDTRVADAGMPHLAALKQLKTLSLERTAVSDAGLESLTALTNLETLLLSGTRVTAAGLQPLARLPNLRTLYLAGCPIEDSRLGELAGLQKLEHLGLTGTGIADEALSTLEKMEGLKHVELWRTQVTQAGVQALRAARPQLIIRADFAADESLQAADTTDAPSAPPRASSSSEDVERAASQVLPPIRQRLASAEETPDFQRHVTALLGRLGCNGRACHGSFQGQGGFRLSMFGYDFTTDLENLHARIDLQQPDQSLLLNKPTSEDEHGGGLRLPAGGWQQQLLRRWIAGGARGVAEGAPCFVRLEVTPSEVVFQDKDESVQLRVVAIWSDGTREDVTELTRFQSNNETVAEVTAGGLIQARGRGDTYVISLYDNGIFSTQVLRPFTRTTGDAYPQVAAGTPLDEHVLAKLRKLGVVPSKVCDDGEFLRRVSLDLAGTLPTPDEITQFLADPAPDKRVAKIDELLERPAYVTWWTTRLCDLTGSNAGYLGGTEMAQPVAQQWRDWIERRVRDNAGWDQIARGIVLARSRKPDQTYADFVREQSGYTRLEDPDDFAAEGNPMPHYWFRSNLTQPSEKALAFGYTFLGVRLECAQCHKHPYDQWSQRDFELFTEFFTRIKAGVAADAAPRHTLMQHMLGVPDKLNTAALRRQSYLRIAAEGRPIPWNEIHIEPPPKKPQPAKLLGAEELDLRNFADPREPLMHWLLNEPNRYFAKAFVNRIWANYFHTGIIDPPDDLNLANPPSNKELLEFLVDGFVANGYDMKWLHRTIASSHTYQRSWRTNESNRDDQRNYSHAIVRRLQAEVAIDAVQQATAGDVELARAATNVTNRKIGQHPLSFQARAIDFSLLVFGKPLRTTNCDCERRGEPTLLQALYLRNDQEMLASLDRKEGWLAQLRLARKQQTEKPSAKDHEGQPAAEMNADEWVRQAYLRTLSRPPDAQEFKDCLTHIRQLEDPVAGLQDVLWALLNTQEFITNH